VWGRDRERERETETECVSQAMIALGELHPQREGVSGSEDGRLLQSLGVCLCEMRSVCVCDRESVSERELE
jgi:hypothetical protein